MMRPLCHHLSLVALSAMLVGCGQKGDLYLPQNTTVAPPVTVQAAPLLDTSVERSLPSPQPPSETKPQKQQQSRQANTTAP